MKVYKNFEEVTEILNAEKLSENAALVSRCGLEGEKIISDINSHKNERLNYLSTILTRKNGDLSKL